jgi:hypothetical protein
MVHYVVMTTIVLAAGAMAFARMFAQSPRLQRQTIRRRVR